MSEARGPGREQRARLGEWRARRHRGASGAADPQKRLHNRKRLITYLWFGQALGLPERSPWLPQLQPPACLG